MKTTFRNTARPLALAALLAVPWLEPGTLAKAGENGSICEACRATVQLAVEAEFAAANAEYLLAKAQANNLPTAEERQGAKAEARTRLAGSKEQIARQRTARKAICRLLREGRYHPVIEPANFLSPEATAANPNPYFPLIPGTLYRYRTETAQGAETAEFRVTRETRVVLGVTCIEVRDTVAVAGVVVEDTRDWYAQDVDGNVWYFGELSVGYQNGEIASLGGSWEGGVKGASPGLIMKASPQVGDAYRQEFLVGEAEDAAQIVALNETVTVPLGTYSNCRKIAEFLPADPDSLAAPAHKFYAPNVGFVKQVHADGELEELIAIENF